MHENQGHKPCVLPIKPHVTGRPQPGARGDAVHLLTSHQELSPSLHDCGSTSNMTQQVQCLGPVCSLAWSPPRRKGIFLLPKLPVCLGKMPRLHNTIGKTPEILVMTLSLSLLIVCRKKSTGLPAERERCHFLILFQCIMTQ